MEQVQEKALEPKNSTKAIASMVCSIVGFFVCLFVGQIIGIVLGHSAKKEIEESKGKLEGMGFAKAGIIIGWIGIVLDILIIIVWTLLFVFVFTTS